MEYLDVIEKVTVIILNCLLIYECYKRIKK